METLSFERFTRCVKRGTISSTKISVIIVTRWDPQLEDRWGVTPGCHRYLFWFNSSTAVVNCYEPPYVTKLDHNGLSLLFLLSLHVLSSSSHSFFLNHDSQLLFSFLFYYQMIPWNMSILMWLLRMRYMFCCYTTVLSLIMSNKLPLKLKLKLPDVSNVFKRGFQLYSHDGIGSNSTQHILT